MTGGQHNLCRNFLSDLASQQEKALKVSESGNTLRTEQYLCRSAKERKEISAIAHIHFHWRTLIKKEEYGESKRVYILREIF
jgi:hypothetical protein